MPKIMNITSPIGIGLLGFKFALGSDFEAPGSRGTHHLMEHLMCKSFDDLLPQMKRLGIDYNAFTSTDRLVFHFEGFDESLEILASELYGRVTKGDFTWTEEAFNNEKQVVLQEYEEVFNQQVGGTLVNLFRKYYDYFDPIGLRTDIESFTYEQSLAFREHFKEPSLLCQVGGPFLNAPESSEHPYTFETPKFGTYDNPLEVVPKEGKTAVGLISRGLIAQAEANKVEFVLGCLNDGLESPLYQVVREKSGLSYFSLGYAEDLRNHAVLTFLASTSKKIRKKLRKVYKDFFSGDLNRHITQERFDDCFSFAMNMKKMKERLPHFWAKGTILEKNPYEGLESLTYLECLGLLSKHFRFEMFEEIEY
jgi:predicted Zn-dependent peptidase